jgi:hypothetical protein
MCNLTAKEQVDFENLVTVEAQKQRKTRLQIIYQLAEKGLTP